jgi:CheY-like chemotaxis protein
LDEAAPTRLLTILIVEDEVLTRHMAVEWLRDAGYQTVEAGSAEEANCFLDNQEPIDVLFTDIRLGGVNDGWDIAEAFREKSPALPVIYTSGYMTKPPRIVDGGLFLTKPYSTDELVGACRKLTVNCRLSRVVS